MNIINFVRTIVFKKEKASSVLSDMIPILLAIVLTGMLAVVYASWVSNFEEKEAVNAIVREYLMRMETVGYLNSEDAKLLKQELSAHHVENVSLAGTTLAPVENGGRVILNVTGKMRLKSVEMESWLKWNFKQNDVCRINITRSTTAIY